MEIRVINGPNLNFLGIREKDKYGVKSYIDLCENLKGDYEEKCNIVFFQSNSEGDIIDYMQNCYTDKVDAIILNAGAYTHYSYAINDCIKSINIPTIEVHITNIHSREDYRRKSVISESCIGVISGFGLESYNMAIEFLLKNLKTIQKN